MVDGIYSGPDKEEIDCFMWKHLMGCNLYCKDGTLFKIVGEQNKDIKCKRSKDGVVDMLYKGVKILK